MIEQGLIQKHFLGRDGFIWWIGQIVDQTQWAGNFPEHPTSTTEEFKRDLDLGIKLESWGIILPLKLTYLMKIYLGHLYCFL